MNYLLMTATVSLLNFINVPVANMREKPAHDSEIVSQAYYSEAISPIEEAGDWVKVETLVDHYSGWMPKSALSQRYTPYPENADEMGIKINRLQAHLYAIPDTVYGPLLTLPFDSRLEIAEIDPDPNSRWIKVNLVDGSQGYIQRGDIAAKSQRIARHEIDKFSFMFLGLPYTWGGRSSFGYDCSGFTQMLYRQMGISLPRDSKDQLKWEGFIPTSLDDLKIGDLIFFGLSENQIRHTATYIGDGNFIHPSVAENKPYLRISSLNDPEWNGTGRLSYRAARTLKQ